MTNDNLNRENPITNNEEQGSKIDYLEIISFLLSKKKFIFLVTAIGIIIAIGISFLITPTYLSTASILPGVDKSKLGNISSLAALASVSLSEEGIVVAQYPDIMKSEIVLTAVLENKYNSKYFDKPVALFEFFNINEELLRRKMEVGLQSLRNMLKIDLSRQTNILTYSIETKDPQVSADIINNLTKSLNDFLLTKRTTNAGEQRKWIEQRLEEVKIDLTTVENALKDFREKNRRVSDSPQLLLEQERLIREVTMNTTIFSTLKQQYELAKIEEIKSVPIINVMDEAKPAAKKNNPKRSIFAIVGMFLSFFGAVGYVVVKNKFGSEIEKYLKIFKPDKKM